MALWIPGPWGNMNGKPQPESPHQAAIAESVEESTKPRRRRASKAEA
jgi:hypothetical protein